MNTLQRRLATALLAALIIPVHVQVHAQTPAPTPAPNAATPIQDGDEGSEMQPKFIWGLIINIAFRFAMNAFTQWVSAKAHSDLNNPVTLSTILTNSTKATVVSLAGGSIFGFKGVGADENTVLGLQTKALQGESGKENYQGVHVSVVGFDRAGNPTGLQPVAAGFRSGDRIKLKVLPTFDGLLVIDNINPQGKRQQIYPGSNQAIAVKAGVEIFVPLGRDEYFEFAGVQGDEQLLITLRDPRAVGEAASKVEVSRKDEAGGSSFVQEVVPGTYPVIAQSLRFKHGN